MPKERDLVDRMRRCRAEPRVDEAHYRRVICRRDTR